MTALGKCGASVSWVKRFRGLRSMRAMPNVWFSVKSNAPHFPSAVIFTSSKWPSLPSLSAPFVAEPYLNLVAVLNGSLIIAQWTWWNLSAEAGDFRFALVEFWSKLAKKERKFIYATVAGDLKRILRFLGNVTRNSRVNVGRRYLAKI